MRLDPYVLAGFNRPVPRYTSYPTAPEWRPLDSSVYVQHLTRLGKAGRPLSLYVHIPFCRSMCLYCACSVVLNRKPEKEEAYVDALLNEASMVGAYVKDNIVRQLHFGGGTPTQLSIPQLTRLLDGLNNAFSIDWTGEMSIEIDPRTVMADHGHKLQELRRLGFNRVSFGVQDTQTKVQEAVKRRQSWEMTRDTYQWANDLGFSGINVDLIYGLPYQTRASFSHTVTDILSLQPSRVAMYSYAKVPWLKPHQRAISDDTLPSAEEKFGIYVDARERFLEAGYVQIGMDHFAQPEDSLAQALKQKRLQRNFQGYSLKLAEDMIGLGMTATGMVDGCYAQNLKTLPDYYETLEKGTLPILRGKPLTADDHIRKWTIHTLMCNFELDTKDFFAQCGIPFSTYYAQIQPAIRELKADGLLKQEGSRLVPTLMGKLFIRNVASIFDAYLDTKLHTKFSKGV